VENVEKLLEETAEAREYQREIDNMLTSSLSLDEEDAVQAELRALQQETLRAQGTTEIPLSLPDAPTTEPIPSEEDTRQLRQQEKGTGRVAIPA